MNNYFGGSAKKGRLRNTALEIGHSRYLAGKPDTYKQ